ncbi:TPA: hypothetical protein OUB44_004006 [Providencia rettgeri]|nr:hypothetical protein [Providencia rettgeri]
MDKKNTLSDISLPGGIESIPDGNSDTEILSEATEPQNLILLQEVEDRKADRDLRERFGDKAYNVVRKTLYGWAVVLAATAFCKFFFDKDIFSENVLIAITSAVTLNTFAAFLGVIRGLFPSNRKGSTDDGK